MWYCIVKTSGSVPKYLKRKNNDFKVGMSVNNTYTKLLVDTGAKVSVCGMKQAKAWGLLDKIVPSNAKIHPYNSEPIKVRGTARCAVTYKSRSVPVEFYILPGSCEPILAGTEGLNLKVLSFAEDRPSEYHPVSMIRH